MSLGPFDGVSRCRAAASALAAAEWAVAAAACTASSPFATGIGYNAANQVTDFKYGNGIYASFGFSSDRLQLTCLDYSTTNRNGTCIHDSTTRLGLGYFYGTAGSNNGLISSISDSVDPGRNATYTYDSLYRLTNASTAGSTNYPAWGLSETYDRYGNRKVQNTSSGCTGITCPTNSVTPDPATNRISGDCYDANGNLLAESAPPCPSPIYTYDAENRLVNYMSSSPTYVYDGDGLRVKKCAPNCTSPTSRTVYIFSGSKVVAEYDNGAAVASPSREYIYAGGALLAKIDSSGTVYYHQDHLSNRLVTNSSGSTVAQMGHFPYGESWYNASGDKLVFTTYERDSESGNDYAQARYNMSRLARFSSPDPAAGSTGDPQSLNRYSYVRNMPVMLTDSSGLCPGGFAQNRDIGDTMEAKGGGPSNTDSDSEQEPTLGPKWPTGPCPGFTDQGGGGGGASGVSIDRGEPSYASGLGPGGMGYPVGNGDVWGLMQVDVYKGPVRSPADEGWGWQYLGTGFFYTGSPGGGGGNDGIALAKSFLAAISNGNFATKQKCRDFLAALIKENGLNISVDALSALIKSTAADAQNYLYDGPSSSVPITATSFPNNTYATVGDSFADIPGQIALSQYDGSAIYIRSSLFQGFFSPFTTSSGQQYGEGVLMHEILHKKAVAGGFNHDQMSDATSAANQGAFGVTGGRNAISDMIGKLCF